MVIVTPLPLSPLERPDTLVEKAGWAPGSVWMGEENLAPRDSNPGPSSP